MSGKVGGFLGKLKAINEQARWAWYLLRVSRILLRHATEALEEIMSLSADGWRGDRALPDEPSPDQ